MKMLYDDMPTKGGKGGSQGGGTADSE